VSHPTWEWPATGTRWRLYHGGGVQAAVADRVATAVASDEARWSRFREDSELSYINRHPGRLVRVSAETMELLSACAHWHEATAGVFQPLVGEALVAWGYAASYHQLSPGAARSPQAAPVAGVLELDPERRAVRIPPALSLDLGGIGKGWMAARAGRLLVELVPEGDLLLDAGGDLVAVRGEHVVAVERPDGEDPDLIALPEGHAVATSGDSRRRWRNGDGAEAHHLIDPATGAPGPSSQATVVAADPVAADVWTKVLALRPDRIAAVGLPALVFTPGRRRRTAPWDEIAA